MTHSILSILSDAGLTGRVPCLVRPAVAGEAFEFLFIHQTHHRGQISQILDEMGLSNNLADNAAYIENDGA